MPSQQPGFDETVDVIVVGFGGAGACAAIEATDQRARTLVIERFNGGGATCRSGGVYYAGSGTDAQLDAGFEDTESEMLAYLRAETGGAVPNRVLEQFCAQSRANTQWLESHGIRFSSTFYPHKATTPPDEYGLYYSGNEKQRSAAAAPVPRGHLPDGRGLKGRVIYEGLHGAVRRRGIPVRYRSQVTQLLTGDKGRVIGVEILSLPEHTVVTGLHQLLFEVGLFARPVVPLIRYLENAAGHTRRIGATGGVIIATGGFMFNATMVKEHAPAYAGCMPLGTPGDDGSGIRLGQDVGAATSAMNECAAWRFIYPPEAFVKGVLVGSDGQRLCDESLYGATVARHIAARPDGHAYLVVDADIIREAREQLGQAERVLDHSWHEILSGDTNALLFSKLSAFLNERINRKKARTVAALEKKCGLPDGALARTLDAYNATCHAGEPDPCGKSHDHRQPIDTPPYWAIRCNLDNPLFLGPAMTLGGLRVDGETGQVLRANGRPISGLYAAGRAAVGLCAGGYVSGLSVADCVFSGRRAGRHAARSD